MSELNKATKWQGIYRGVSFEIVNWRDGRSWNYYLIMPLAQLPDESYWLDEPTNIHSTGYEYFGAESHPILASVESHCGWTLYERIDINNYRKIRIGCDYGHLFDENQSYRVEDIEQDARMSIDSLWECIPNLKVNCQTTGNWYDVSGGDFVDDIFYSHEGGDLRVGWGWKRLPEAAS